MSLDNTEREPALRITGTQAVKLVQHDGNSFIALTLNTKEGRRRFFISEEEARQFANNIEKALDSQGLNPIT